VTITEEMIEAGLARYSEGGCSGLDDRERREVVADIIEAAMSSAPTPPDKTGRCVRCDGTGVGYDGRVCMRCDGAGSAPTPPATAVSDGATEKHRCDIAFLLSVIDSMNEATGETLLGADDLAIVNEIRDDAGAPFRGAIASSQPATEATQADSERLRAALTRLVRNGQKQGWNDQYDDDMDFARAALAPTPPATAVSEQTRRENEWAAFHAWWEESGHKADPIFTLTMENCAHAAWQERAALAPVPAREAVEVNDLRKAFMAAVAHGGIQNAEQAERAFQAYLVRSRTTEEKG